MTQVLNSQTDDLALNN